MTRLLERVPKLSGAAWESIIRRSIVITIFIVTASAGVSAVVMLFSEGQLNYRSLTVATLMPLLLVPPFTFVLGIKKQELKAHNEELKKLAFTDSLLECKNRRGFTEEFDIVLKTASHNQPCALLVVDADNFKNVNDLYGHSNGDRALGIIANAIQSAIRSEDVLGRVGGEEFAIILPDTDEPNARAIAIRVCEAVEAAQFIPYDERHILTVSVGGAIATEVTEFDRLYDAADHQLYVAKEAGRNRSEFEAASRERVTHRNRKTDAA